MPQRPSVTMLVAAAAKGDDSAWNALVDRYAGLVVAVCRSYRLRPADVADVSQTVWLRLVERLETIREPEALPGWLVTTTSHEAIQVGRSQKREESFDASRTEGIDNDLEEATVGSIVAAERQQALRDGFAELGASCQRLLALLLEDPPLPYDEIAARLSVPVGSVGPTRSRCLEKLRRTPAFLALTTKRRNPDVVKG